MSALPAVLVDNEHRRAERSLTRVAGEMRLNEILDRIAEDHAAHVTGDPAAPEDLAQLEAALGHGIPATLRHFLGRFGGGLFYQGHEIFGPRRIMIHDIELVPSLLNFRASLGREGQPREGLLPFHRSGALVHFIDPVTGAVVSSPPGTPYPDLACFLEAVVLPPAGP